MVFDQWIICAADLPGRCEAGEGKVPTGDERVGRAHEGDGT